jgi:N-acetylmuramoyl-L-alanine amidase
LAKKKISTVVIDPGHGGIDPGAVWKKIYEKDITLSIALKLGNYIKKYLPDVKVIYTREKDTSVPLNERPEIANKNQADLFISIHVNSTEKNWNPEGIETYIMGLSKSNEILEVAKKENAVILLEDNYASKYGGYDPNSPVSYIIFSNLQNTHSEQSLNFASTIQEQFKESTRRINRGVKQDRFLVLWKTTMPSVLVETGFITNEEDRTFLTSEQGQDLIALSIYKAFNTYRREIEDRSFFANHRDTLPVAQEPITKDTIVPVSNTVINSNDSAEVPITSTIEFMVQISSSKNPIPINSEQFKGLKNVEVFKTDDGYKYAVGRKPSYDKIQEYSKIVKNYFPDAFIIALRNGKIIPIKEALKEIKN